VGGWRQTWTLDLKKRWNSDLGHFVLPHLPRSFEFTTQIRLCLSSYVRFELSPILYLQRARTYRFAHSHRRTSMSDGHACQVVSIPPHARVWSRAPVKRSMHTNADVYDYAHVQANSQGRAMKTPTGPHMRIRTNCATHRCACLLVVSTYARSTQCARSCSREHHRARSH
jgi:hypothetical protein